ncbi:hypothetical protein NBH00_05690 [Paraconexibacter antarcticus]|uniref:Uncharacterized protein n=1 Tax=Paraconexibacter antarcticus TaxID=2949664 RepID=A0ABY5DUM1_9ACTN|nr:hypothetical protein [Paraconexibacter antarcticus]UTI65703.1 hypothetical protein NBH00_05690 [Paraconexibacter antarcticus]
MTADLPPPARVSAFDLLKVNQTVLRVGRGGHGPLCQAIPVTAVRVRLRWAGLRPGRVVRLTVVPPGHAARTRAVRVRARDAGRRTVELTASALGLRDAAFAEGRYAFTLRTGGRRVDRTTLTLTPPTTRSC